VLPVRKGMRWLLLLGAIAFLVWLGSLMWHTFFLGQY
jgi:hypothetical protein